MFSWGIEMKYRPELGYYYHVTHVFLHVLPRNTSLENETEILR